MRSELEREMCNIDLDMICNRVCSGDRLTEKSSDDYVDVIFLDLSTSMETLLLA